jgi:hypothetical protein
MKWNPRTVIRCVQTTINLFLESAVKSHEKNGWEMW